jgi:hypothetical protein
MCVRVEWRRARVRRCWGCGTQRGRRWADTHSHPFSSAERKPIRERMRGRGRWQPRTKAQVRLCVYEEAVMLLWHAAGRATGSHALNSFTSVLQNKSREESAYRGAGAKQTRTKAEVRLDACVW